MYHIQVPHSGTETRSGESQYLNVAAFAAAVSRVSAAAAGHGCAAIAVRREQQHCRDECNASSTVATQRSCGERAAVERARDGGAAGEREDAWAGQGHGSPDDCAPGERRWCGRHHGAAVQSAAGGVAHEPVVK